MTSYEPFFLPMKNHLANRRKILFLIGVAVLLGNPSFAFADLFINEIMYDLEGSDTNREWIEIYNSGGAAIPFSEYKLFEANTNHALTPVQGGSSIPAGGFAIIVEDASNFLTDHPGFSGVIFDSSFSLSNTGESLSLKDSSLTEVVNTTYSSSLGAAGDGNTLQLVSGSFSARTPTPGTTNSSSGSPPEVSPPQTETASTTASNSTTSNGSMSKGKVDQQIFPSAGEDFVGVVGAAVVFTGSALGIDKKPLTVARFLWNFGDGSSKEGKTASHIYHFPGEYLATLDVASGEYSNSDLRKVLIVPPAVSIATFLQGDDGFTELYNAGEYDVDISFWQLHQAQTSFAFPDHTILLHGKKTKFPNQVTLLLGSGQIVLSFPNGSVVPSSASEAINEKKEVITTTTSPAPPKGKVVAKKASGKEVIITPKEQVASLAEVSSPYFSRSLISGGVAISLAVAVAFGVWFLRKVRRKREVIEGFDIIEE